MITTKAELQDYLSTERALWIRTNFPKGASKRIKSRELDFVESLRYVEYFNNFSKWKRLVFGGGTYFFHTWRYRYLSEKHGVSIPPNVFGKGLLITHLQNIIVSSNVRVGQYCRLFHNITLGIKLGEKAARTCPSLGDGITICTGAVVVGGIKVADGVTIGANAVLSRSVDEENVVVAGAPARIKGANTGFSMIALKNELGMK